MRADVTTPVNYEHARCGNTPHTVVTKNQDNRQNNDEHRPSKQGEVLFNNKFIITGVIFLTVILMLSAAIKM